MSNPGFHFSTADFYRKVSKDFYSEYERVAKDIDRELMLHAKQGLYECEYFLEGFSQTALSDLLTVNLQKVGFKVVIQASIYLDYTTLIISWEEE